MQGNDWIISCPCSRTHPKTLKHIAPLYEQTKRLNRYSLPRLHAFTLFRQDDIAAALTHGTENVRALLTRGSDKEFALLILTKNAALILLAAGSFF